MLCVWDDGSGLPRRPDTSPQTRLGVLCRLRNEPASNMPNQNRDSCNIVVELGVATDSAHLHAPKIAG